MSRTVLVAILILIELPLFAQESPVVENIVSCGAGLFTLEAESATPGVTYRWYDQNNLLIEGVEGPTYNTEEIINSTRFFVSAVLNTIESSQSVIEITVQNTASILEGTEVGLCGGNVTLNSEVTLGDLSNASYQWQAFESFGSGQPSSGEFEDVSAVNGGTTGLSLTVLGEGFYRIIVTDENTGCTVISEAIKVVFNAPYESAISGSEIFCFPSVGEVITSAEIVPTGIYPGKYQRIM